jgi:hypothetical protein
MAASFLEGTQCAVYGAQAPSAALALVSAPRKGPALRGGSACGADDDRAEASRMQPGGGLRKNGSRSMLGAT